MESSKRTERNFIRKQGLVSFVTFLSSTFVWFRYGPLPVPDDTAPSQRIVYACRWQILPLLPVIALIGMIANRRLHTSAIDPVHGKGEQYLDIYQRILRNNMEQFLIHFVSSVSLSSYLTGEYLKLIPFFAIAFLIGRIVFFFGYTSSSTLNRAFGMSITFFVNYALLGSSLVCLVTKGPLFALDG